MFKYENLKPKYVIPAISLGIIGIGLIGYYLYRSPEAKVQNARIAITECNNSKFSNFIEVEEFSDTKNRGMNNIMHQILCEQGLEGKVVDSDLTLLTRVPDHAYLWVLSYEDRKCAYELLLTSGVYRQMESGCSLLDPE